MISHWQMPLRTNGVRLCSRWYTTRVQPPRLAEWSSMPRQPWCERLPEQVLSCSVLSLTQEMNTEKREGLTCAQNYNLSVGKINFV